jgi:hypothetical protein
MRAAYSDDKVANRNGRVRVVVRVRVGHGATENGP